MCFPWWTALPLSVPDIVFAFHQVVYVIKVSVSLARMVAANSIPAVHDRNQEALLVSALALDDSQFQTGYVCFSKVVTLSTNATTDLTDTPSTLFKFSLATLKVTGSARFQQVPISSPSGTVERLPEVVQALHVQVPPVCRTCTRLSCVPLPIPHMQHRHAFPMPPFIPPSAHTTTLDT